MDCFFLFCFAVLSPSTPTLCEHPMSSAAIWANKLWPAIPHTQWGASGEKCSSWTHGQNMANRDQSRRSWGNRKAKPFNWIKDKAATMKCQGNALRKCQTNSANIQLNILKNHLTLLSDALLIFLTNLVTISLYLKTTSLQFEYVEIYALLDLLKVALGTDVPLLTIFK